MWAALIWTIAGWEYSEPVKTVEDNLTLLGRQLPEGKRFFGGDTIGFLDIAVSGISLWLEVFEEVAGVPLLTEEKHPAFCRWAREYTAGRGDCEAVPAGEEPPHYRPDCKEGAVRSVRRLSQTCRESHAPK
jgi:glutathione S-transferase